MKLLHVVASMDPKQGGVSQAVRSMVKGLAARGVGSEIVCLDAANAPWVKTGVGRMHALGPGRGSWSYNAALRPWLITALPRFDAVILHGLWLYQGYALRKALRRLSAQQATRPEKARFAPTFFVMPHGMLDPYFQRTSGRRLKALRNQMYWRLVEGAVVNEAHGMLFTCETERLLAYEPFAPYKPRRECVVGLGIEVPPPFAPDMHAALLARCPALANRPYLLFLGRIDDKKGVELLVQAYANLHAASVSFLSGDNEITGNAQSLPNRLPALVIAGPGTDTPYGLRLRALAAELLESKIFFPGMLTGDAKWGAFYGCDAFVLPSHQENFGIAVVEALACGRPVLISNQVNIWREIEASGGGIVGDDTLPGTQQLLSSWTELAAAGKKRMGEKALAAYRQHFAIEPATDKLLEALRETLS